MPKRHLADGLILGQHGGGGRQDMLLYQGAGENEPRASTYQHGQDVSV